MASWHFVMRKHIADKQLLNITTLCSRRFQWSFGSVHIKYGFALVLLGCSFSCIFICCLVFVYFLELTSTVLHLYQAISVSIFLFIFHLVICSTCQWHVSHFQPSYNSSQTELIFQFTNSGLILMPPKKEKEDLFCIHGAEVPERIPQ